MATVREIQELYIGYLGRAADWAGLDYWYRDINNGPMTLENLRLNFVNEQPEYAAEYAGLNRAQTLSKIYENLFERQFDQAGFDYWLSGEGAAVPIDQLIVAFLAAASPADRQVLDHKWEVANLYTNAAGTEAFHRSSATAAIADVGWDPASKDAPYQMIGTALQNLREESNPAQVRFLGVHEKNPNIAENFTLNGRTGQTDYYLINTDNFSYGDTVWIANLETRDQLITGHNYAHRETSPSNGRADLREIFVEQEGPNVRMTLEMDPAGTEIMKVMIVGATVAEMEPIGGFLP